MNDGARPVELDCQWALHGKRPGTDYQILACSTGDIDADGYAEILHRFSTGTPEHLPQIVLSWAGREQEQGRIGMAIQEAAPPGQVDGFGRAFAYTRYFCFPYADVADRPVTYTEFYRGIRGLDQPENRDPARCSLAPMNAALIGPAVTAQARSAAALLLTGRQVVVYGCDYVPLDERLKFLDVVASLLPYGMRTRYSAATWASSVSDHSLRLTFAHDKRSGAHNLLFGEPAEVPAEYPVARQYHDWLRSFDDPAEPIELLTRVNEPLRLQDGARALELLQHAHRPKEPAQTVVDVEGHPAVRPPVTEAAPTLQFLISALNVAVRNRNRPSIDNALTEITRLAARSPTRTERDDAVESVRETQILQEGTLDKTDPHVRSQILDAILAAVFSPLTEKHIDEISGMAGGLREELLSAMLRMGEKTQDVDLIVANLLPAGAARTAFANMALTDLIAFATRWPKAVQINARIIDRLERDLSALRPEVPGEIIELLERHYFLSAAIFHLSPPPDPRKPAAADEAAYTRLRELLRLAYGDAPRAGSLNRMTGLYAEPDRALLRLAALERIGTLKGYSPWTILVEEPVARARLEAETKRRIERLLDDEPPSDESTDGQSGQGGQGGQGGQNDQDAPEPPRGPDDDGQGGAVTQILPSDPGVPPKTPRPFWRKRFWRPRARHRERHRGGAPAVRLVVGVGFCLVGLVILSRVAIFMVNLGGD
ncbi:hypothetical protein [Actinocorallia herbida]|uniref:hypothetical protein n=1 Tax=Actinocorallia herbida TaxID=58109 RepID=UPI000F4BD2C3|nr:hypothetical protein [Actinocorallia herbida]